MTPRTLLCVEKPPSELLRLSHSIYTYPLSDFQSDNSVSVPRLYLCDSRRSPLSQSYDSVLPSWFSASLAYIMEPNSISDSDSDPNMQTCVRCREDKPVEEFVSRTSAKRPTKWCLACRIHGHEVRHID